MLKLKKALRLRLFKFGALALLLLFIFSLFLLSQGGHFLLKRLDMLAIIYPALLADLANFNRQQEKVPTLIWNEDLAKAAKLKAEDMLVKGYFAHQSPTGVTPWFWLKKVGYDFAYAGENLAVDFTESVDVQKAWLDSPKHRENIMNSNFREVGIATIDGVFEGKPTTFVVEFFGTPLAVKSQSGIDNLEIVKETGKFIMARNLDAKMSK